MKKKIEYNNNELNNILDNQETRDEWSKKSKEEKKK